MCRLLLSRDIVEVSIDYGRMRASSLWKAASHGRLGIVRLLLDNKISKIKGKDKLRTAPLHVAGESRSESDTRSST